MANADQMLNMEQQAGHATKGAFMRATWG
jgi:hypothetical protein